jgi:hypothetical protein
LMTARQELSTIVEACNKIFEAIHEWDAAVKVPVLSLDSLATAYPGLPLDEAAARHERSKVALRQLDAQLHETWTDLRRDEFLERKEELRHVAARARARLGSLAMELPPDWNSASRNTLCHRIEDELQKAIAASTEALREVGKLENRVKELERKRHALLLRIDEAKKVLLQRTHESADATRLLELAETLVSIGLLKRGFELELSYPFGLPRH